MIKVSNYMYGDDGEPWLSMRLWYWKEKGTIDVWAYFLTARYCVEFIFWMSLKSTFLAFKKMVQVVQIGGWE